MPVIQLISDVHSRWDRVRVSPKADLIVAAGDLSEDMEGIQWLKDSGKRALYIPGNHEYYGSDVGSRIGDLERAAQNSRATIMDKKGFVIGGHRLLCATLWTDQNSMDPDLMARCSSVMNDYRNIEAKAWHALPGNAQRYASLWKSLSAQNPAVAALFPRIPTHMNPLISIILHREAEAFLAKEIARPWNGKTWVFTHHAPSFQSLIFGGYFATADPGLFHSVLHLKRKPHKIAAYANSMEGIISSGNVSLWAHGHLHEGIRYSLLGADVVTNPTGYSDAQNSLYRESFLLDMEDESLHPKVVALSLEKTCQMQSEFIALLQRCRPPNEDLGGALFPAWHDFDIFCLIYNQAIAAPLSQDAKAIPAGAQKPSPMNASSLPSKFALSDSARTDSIRKLLSLAKENLLRSQFWLSETLSPLSESGWALAKDIGE